MKVQGIIEMIDIERENQLLKWGEQEHDDLFWLAILGEEYGESAAAILQGKAPQTLSEVVQCAAVCVAWLEDWYHSCPDTLRNCREIIESRLAESRASVTSTDDEDTRSAQSVELRR